MVPWMVCFLGLVPWVIFVGWYGSLDGMFPWNGSLGDIRWMVWFLEWYVSLEWFLGWYGSIPARIH